MLLVAADGMVGQVLADAVHEVGEVRPVEPEPPGQAGLERERGQRRPGALVPV
jgi:hypothetical protein